MYTFQLTVSNHCPLLHCLAPLRRVCFQVIGSTQLLYRDISIRLLLATSSPSSTSSSSPTILAAFWPFTFSTCFLTWRLERKPSAHRAVSHVRFWDATLLGITGLATHLSLLWLVREGFTSSPAPPAIIDWTAGLQQALTSKERLITWDCRFFHMLSLIYTGFKQCFKCSACITKISSDFNCKFPFPFKTRKHRITISYSQLILHQSLQKSHSGESHRSATWLWEHTSPSHASQRAQGTEEWEESTPYSTRTARTGRQVRQRVKRCGGLAWRPRWCIPRHLENFSTKRFGGSLELGHHLPEHDRRNTLVGEAHWRYWVTHSGWTLAKQGHTKRNSLLRA